MKKRRRIKAKVAICDFCQKSKIIASDNAEMKLVGVLPLPPINLSTGEKGKPGNPYSALCIMIDEDCESEYFPVEFCPICGRKL